MITLQKGRTKVTINELGAEMKSFTVDGVDYIWTGNPDVWARSAPNIFPMTGGFRDDKYILNGKEYVMPKHGFALNSIFEVESQSDTEAVFVLRENEDTLKVWPYAFEYRVCYKLDDEKISVDYKVTNKNDNTMYFSVGSHDGFATPEGIEEYDIVFAEKETLDSYTLFGNLIGEDKTRIIENSDTLSLKYDYFAVDALVFKDVKSDVLKLVNRKTGRGIELQFPNFPVLMVWTKPGAGYVCIEPWFGAPDDVNSNYDITIKFAIQSVAAGDTFTCTRVITALEGK